MLALDPRIDFILVEELLFPIVEPDDAKSIFLQCLQFFHDLIVHEPVDIGRVDGHMVNRVHVDLALVEVGLLCPEPADLAANGQDVAVLLEVGQ